MIIDDAVGFLIVSSNPIVIAFGLLLLSFAKSLIVDWSVIAGTVVESMIESLTRRKTDSDTACDASIL